MTSGDDTTDQAADPGTEVAPQAASAVTPSFVESTDPLGSRGNPHRVTSESEVLQLPSGAHFLAPDGKVRFKP